MIEIDCCLKCREPLQITTDRQIGNFIMDAILFCPSGHGIDGTGERVRERLVTPMTDALIGLSYVDAVRRAMQKSLADFRKKHETQKETEND